MKTAKSKQDIMNHAEGRGSCNCGLTAFKQGKKVFLCNQEDDVKDVVKQIIKEVYG